MLTLRSLPRLALTAALLFPSSALHAATSRDSASDPILAAMQAELAREQAQLVLPGMLKPYFIEYRLDDMSTYEAVANFGALVQDQANHQRVVRVTVRIGDYQHDSSSTRGDGTASLTAIDDNPQAIRYALWIATDDAYKNALRAY